MNLLILLSLLFQPPCNFSNKVEETVKAPVPDYPPKRGYPNYPLFPPTVVYHPYRIGGTAMIFFGTTLASFGGMWLLTYESNFNSMKTGSTPDILVPNYKVYVGSSILMSSGVTFIIGGIVLYSLRKKSKYLLSFDGTTLHF